MVEATIRLLIAHNKVSQLQLHFDRFLCAHEPPGRSQGEYRSAKREACPMSPPNRPEGEHRSAQHEGTR
ncbi:MAG: hypothetical protein ABI699_07345 [Caldimonas sp.]